MGSQIQPTGAFIHPLLCRCVATKPENASPICRDKPPRMECENNQSIKRYSTHQLDKLQQTRPDTIRAWDVVARFELGILSGLSDHFQLGYFCGIIGESTGSGITNRRHDRLCLWCLEAIQVCLGFPFRVFYEWEIWYSSWGWYIAIKAQSHIGAIKTVVTRFISYTLWGVNGYFAFKVAQIIICWIQSATTCHYYYLIGIHWMWSD